MELHSNGGEMQGYVKDAIQFNLQTAGLIKTTKDDSGEM